uniref:Putative golgi integral membrane protein 4 n=1 Tax=Rhipicephalus pulchellus TaxID=72859 RepID=L7LYP2_RHIPC
MNTAVIMRNSKVRTFLYVLLGCCMLFTVFLLSSTHTKLKDSQESNDKCQQQRDSLSAQLQVVYEHKSRLEKTLQLETTDRKKAEDAVKTVRDQAERDRSDARDKIKSLDKELTELKASQAEEFKNLKTSFDTLHQEKEKVDNELANHVALLQQERDSKAKLARQLEEVLQARKTEGQLDLMLQRQLETCRTETAHLYAKLQQQSAAQSQHVVASGGQKPVANAPDLSAGNGPAHVAAPAPSLTQGGGEQKANAKEDKGAGKLGPPYQVAGPESWPPKVVVGEPGDSLRPIINNAKNPVPAAQALAPPNDSALQQPAKVSTAVSQAAGGLSSTPGKVAHDGMLAPLQPEGKANRGSSELSALPKNQGHQPVGQKPPVVSQPGVPQVALQPSVQAEPSQRPPAQPLARPVAQPAVQEEQQLLHKPLQQPAHLGANPEPLSQIKAQLAQLNVDQPAAFEQGFKPAEQPPVVNQAPPVLPAPSIAKAQPPAAGLDSVAGLEKMPAGDMPVPAKAPSSRGGAGAAAAAFKKAVDVMGLEEGNELELGAEKVLSNRVPNNGDDLLIGGRAGKAPRANKLARPNQQQQLAAGGIGGGEDDLEYGNAGKSVL